MSTSASDPRRALPAVGRLLEDPRIVDAQRGVSRRALVEALRSVLQEARMAGTHPSADDLVEAALAQVLAFQRRSLKRAINATGVILHTGLGRAVLCEAARRAIAEVAEGHCTLEIDLTTGRRGDRQLHVSSLLSELTGAESAAVVNNNAGAVLLAVTVLAAGREVVISRGELVEIGGSFRMPDIIRASGARLVEVGTTNRTRLEDYEDAMGPDTGLILRCHPSNFRIVGFTEEAPAEGLVELGRRAGVPVMEDLGSGALLQSVARGAGPVGTLGSSIQSGFDIVTASGDKLLGGPQAGIIVGKQRCVERIRRHPMARALRVDKLTLAALEATLRVYRDAETAAKEIPALRYLFRTRAQIGEMAGRLEALIREQAGSAAEVVTVEGVSQVGGGSLPGEELPTLCVAVRPLAITEEALAACLRNADPPVFGRLEHGILLLDPRTLEEEEIATVARAVGTCCRRAAEER
ncbi:MAG: L-seryl-tRNA(Sec) selenium transferase [Chthonomonadales bacterium]